MGQPYFKRMLRLSRSGTVGYTVRRAVYLLAILPDPIISLLQIFLVTPIRVDLKPLRATRQIVSQVSIAVLLMRPLSLLIQKRVASRYLIMSLRKMPVRGSIR